MKRGAGFGLNKIKLKIFERGWPLGLQVFLKTARGHNWNPLIILAAAKKPQTSRNGNIVIIYHCHRRERSQLIGSVRLNHTVEMMIRMLRQIGWPS